MAFFLHVCHFSLLFICLSKSFPLREQHLISGIFESTILRSETSISESYTFIHQTNELRNANPKERVATTMHKYRSATCASRSRIGKQRFILLNNYCHCNACDNHKRTICKSRNHHKSTLHRRWERGQMCKNINPTGQTPVWFCKDMLALPIETKANCGAIFEIDLLKETTQKHVII